MGVGSPKAAAHHPAKQNNKCTSELGGRRRPPVTLALVHIPLAAELTASRSPQAQPATTSSSAAACSLILPCAYYENSARKSNSTEFLSPRRMQLVR
jgi:hypothetical protein